MLFSHEGFKGYGMDSLVFGQRLKHFRKRNNYTLAELGALVHKPAPYLSQLENGLTEPRVSLVRDLATVLDCTPADLLTLSLQTEEQNSKSNSNAFKRIPAARKETSYIRPSTRMPDEILEHIIGVYRIEKTHRLQFPTQIHQNMQDIRIEIYAKK